MLPEVNPSSPQSTREHSIKDSLGRVTCREFLGRRALAVAALTASLLGAASVAKAASNKTKARDASNSTGNQQAAFGVESIKLGGVMGHRIETMVKGNLFMLEMEKSFLSYFRGKNEEKSFRGIGLLLDGAVHLAAYSQQEELTRWKDHWIDELISTQDVDGYIGIIRPGSNRGKANFDLSEKGCVVLALVNDYRIFGTIPRGQAAMC